MIILIAGLPGAGKTALMTYFACKSMTVDACPNVRKTNEFIANLNAGGYSFDYAKEHLTYSNYDITSHWKGYRPRKSYKMEGYEFGLPDSEHPTKFVYRYATLCFTEAQAFLNSRAYKKFRDSVSRAYEQHRHWDLTIYLDAQRATLIDLNVRELSKVIYVHSINFKNNRLGQIVRTTWNCEEFETLKDYDSFNANKKDYQSKKTKYVYDGDVTKCYDSKMNAVLFLQGAKGKQFACEEYEEVSLTVTGVEEFCKKKSIDAIKVSS